MMTTRRARFRAWTATLALATTAMACSIGASDSGAPNPTDDASDCARALSHFEELRLASLESDPVLAQFPDLAREHARQTRDVFDAPRAARCSDPAFVSCLKSADTFDKAAACQ